MINLMELSNKHIIITGASSGIGRACAIQASRLGAKVTIIARSEDKLMETINLMEGSSKHTYYVFDLNHIEEIEALIKKIVIEQGAVDGLCHAAGIANPRTLKFSNPQYVNKIFNIHIFAFVELVRALSLKHNLNDGASLVGISSVAAERGNTAQAVYGAAKGAMNSFVKPAARELAKRKIRINNVAYGIVNTKMYQDFLETGGDEEVIKQQYLGLIDTETAANAVMFLLSGASKFTTGSIIPVYAGY